MLLEIQIFFNSSLTECSTIFIVRGRKPRNGRATNNENKFSTVTSPGPAFQECIGTCHENDPAPHCSSLASEQDWMLYKRLYT